MKFNSCLMLISRILSQTKIYNGYFCYLKCVFLKYVSRLKKEHVFKYYFILPLGKADLTISLLFR